jgi:uncharacterized protein involved in exopolysaccharide biosynthesis
MFVGGAIAALLVSFNPALYRASTSFVAQGIDPSRSGLASLAGQLGVSLPAAAQSQSLSPDFYAKLLKSRELLGPIALDTFIVREAGNRRIPFTQLFDTDAASERIAQERGIKRLQELITASVAKTTGVVELSVTTRWPTVSLAMVKALVDGVNNFNLRTRQGQAAAEGKFVQNRLDVAGGELRAAEDRLEHFMATNRQVVSPELTFQRERLQREVSLQQQVFTSLKQAYEDIRIREVRDTPIITIVESPWVSPIPEPRGRINRVILGLVAGGLFGMLLAFISQTIARRRLEGDIEVDEFAETLGEMKADVLGRVPWLKERKRP